MKRVSESFIVTLVALVFGICAGLAIAALVGENPVNVFMIMMDGAFGSATRLGYSLYYATPLIFTGIAVAWAFKAGLFNIGAEGQMTLGGVAMAISGILFADLPALVAIPFALVAAFVTGGFWGAIAGWIKAKRGCHEVLSTILLNFIAYGLASFLILSVFKNPDSQVPETAEVGAGFVLSQISFLGGTSPLNWSLFFALAAVLVFGFIFSKTRLGFYQRIAGSAAGVGSRAGINMDRQVILAMFLSGGVAALAAASPVLGFALKAREGFAGGAGFVGIAVALLGRNTPLGILLSAILFGALTKGALDLDLDTENVSRDLSVVIQAFIIMAVASQAGLLALFRRWQERKGAA